MQQIVEMTHTDVDVFYYKFSYQGRFSHYYLPDHKPYGVVHSDDLYYLFNKHTAPFFTSEDPEYHMVDVMTRLWANFATTGYLIINIIHK